MLKSEIYFGWYYDFKGKLRHKTIYVRYFKEKGILELHCETGIPMNVFMGIKKKKSEGIELRVI